MWPTDFLLDLEGHLDLDSIDITYTLGEAIASRVDHFF